MLPSNVLNLFHPQRDLYVDTVVNSVNGELTEELRTVISGKLLCSCGVRVSRWIMLHKR